ncbi:MAG: hypothetical protein B6243_10445 [Anaerolineaceae bacterium 4572_5.2]|nr:MAG: hypothetical protein B6243_10445 [Anaerolineaceae bacterium 4572_5.2]
MDVKAFQSEFVRLMKLQEVGEDKEREIHAILDDGYEVYLNSSEEYASEIRDAIVVDDFTTWYKTGYKVLMNYRKRAEKQLRETGDIEWLKKYLVAFSIDNGSFDFRDDGSIALPSIYDLAVEKEIDPRPIFLQVAGVSDENEARGGFGNVKRWLTEYGKRETLDLSQREKRGSRSVVDVIIFLIPVVFIVWALATHPWETLLLIVLFAPYFIYKRLKYRKGNKKLS